MSELYTYEVRQATKHDLTGIMLVETECFAASQSPLHVDYEAGLRDCVKKKAAWVVEHDGVIVASIRGNYYRRKTGFYIQLLSTAKTYRNRGLASLLMSHVEGLEKLNQVYLKVRHENSTAIAMYVGRDYRSLEFNRHLYGEGKHGWTLVKAIEGQ